MILASGIVLVVALDGLRSRTLDGARARNEALAHAIEEQTARALQAVDLQLRSAGAALQRGAGARPPTAGAGRLPWVERTDADPGRCRMRRAGTGWACAALGPRGYFDVRVT